MPKMVNLDAMIPRADFCELEDDAPQSQMIQSLGLLQLDENSFLVPNLRKPDFQRETNQWTPAQVVAFLKSFLDNELVPSVILWKSPTNIFLIDGAHRLSVLVAWIRDDYGDGNNLAEILWSTDFQIPSCDRRLVEEEDQSGNRQLHTGQAGDDVYRERPVG